MADYTAMQDAINKIAAEENMKISTSTLKTKDSTSNLYTKRDDAAKTANNVTYTLFASGLNHGGRDVELKNKNTSTDLAIIFDVVDTHSYSRSVSKTQYAAENKVNYSDHAVIDDGKFSFTARVNSSPMYLIQNNYIDKDTDSNNPMQSKRPQKALDALNKMISDRELVTLVTEDIILENYICTSMTADRSSEEGDALVFQLEFTEFRTFILGKTVLATNFSDAKKSGTKQKGAVNSSTTQQEADIMQKRTIFIGDSAEGYQKVSNVLGTEDKTTSLQKVGTYTSDGKFLDLNGNALP
ncbi:hypothetical protein pEaSNUABM56_00108 [Erwinia phage pEa_SNUABM_56]|uniref:Dit-like phage tail protein N-terminal domain-containing protein n=1 Tax=Erwinia phage pEp_SNUABM_01 TaxID=2601643 RepID=A0A5J6DAS5_9CAUD|nr:hypothetical protein HWC63_gp081 [Erwinia phage pEp_SNUABM_01]QEQ94907.1 hypothetical protein pEpSNUABM01_081 [Erwinia phage pEp_SNUABM_01]UYL84837.1 hypothetical protein pEaSNUABM55_00039 [Erwinia phage pEa_SNUABM_55]UYL85153.1 hypothetical protein pEaSNUABM56_00108 [Erwinia phage pEa_SNUABM_56]